MALSWQKAAQQFKNKFISSDNKHYKENQKDVSENLNKSSSFNLVDGNLQVLVKEVGPDGHLQRVERVLERKVGVEFVNFLQQLVDAQLLRIADHQELDPGDRLHAVQLERVSFLSRKETKFRPVD